MSNTSDVGDLIISTRSRRANAGNKMQKLLDQELEGIGNTIPLDEDEVALLFQEDEYDEEFRIEAKKRDAEEEMFSDSDTESSKNSDAEEGERELEKEERQRRRVMQKKKNQIPVIKRAKVENKEKFKKIISEELSPETLLNETRRTSKRSSVVANKLKVYEKLTKAELKRKEIQEKLKKQRESRNQEYLTQEDRLRIAEETERMNISSLNKYKEQEISKKQTRLAMQLREKMKFKEGEQIVSWVSTQWKFSPNDEIEDRIYWGGVLSKKDKRRKKYGRKKKVEPEASEELESGKKSVESISAEKVTESDEISPNREGFKLKIKLEVKTDEGKESKLCPPMDGITEKVEEDIVQASELDSAEGLQGTTVDDTKEAVDDFKNVEDSDTKTPQVECSMESIEHDKGSSGETDTAEDSKVRKMETSRALEGENADEGASGVNEKHITFSEQNEITIMDSEDPPMLIRSPTIETSEIEDHTNREEAIMTNEGDPKPKIIYEGPNQKVGRNFITLYSFPDGACKFQNNEVKSTLFGSQWAQPTNSRAQMVENIGFLKMPEAEHEADYLLLPDTSILDKFPRFGEFDKKLSHKISVETNIKDKVEITTEAPMGVFLPNGVRKNCLITNKECKYFDPRNGVPYSDVTAIKVIQELLEYYSENGEMVSPNYQWFGFGRGGIYLDVASRPAKGVPEGFK